MGLDSYKRMHPTSPQQTRHPTFPPYHGLDHVRRRWMEAVDGGSILRPEQNRPFGSVSYTAGNTIRSQRKQVPPCDNLTLFSACQCLPAPHPRTNPKSLSRIKPRCLKKQEKRPLLTRLSIAPDSTSCPPRALTLPKQGEDGPGPPSAAPLSAAC